MKYYNILVVTMLFFSVSVMGTPINASLADTELDSIGKPSKILGTFPYLKAPEGYKYSSEVDKRIEQKYFFKKNGQVLKVSGRYFHATIFPATSVFEETFVVNYYINEIEKLGGVQIYSGGIPEAARLLINNESPAYVKDMYDPIPYKYKQFQIITNTKKNLDRALSWTKL